VSAQPGGFKLRRELIQDEILEQLRKSIVAGSFRPGERLNEASLCEQFGVSRAPVREALKQLVAEGLLVKIPHKGCFVVELTAKDIREIYSLRHALEILAVKLVVENVVPEQLEPLRMILTEMKASIDQRDIMDPGIWTRNGRQIKWARNHEKTI